MTDKHHLQAWHNVTIRNNVIVENLHFYTPLLMLREDLWWTDSVEERDRRLQDYGWRGWRVDGGPLTEKLQGGLGKVAVQTSDMRDKWPSPGREPYFTGGMEPHCSCGMKPIKLKCNDKTQL